jgi:DNA-directed RNA polymerase beta' subunit
MNLHLPQSIEAATELREIAAVPLQIISPRESTPIVSVVQDTLVGANRFTRSTTLFTLKEAMNLLVHSKRWEGKMPEPAVKTPQPMWTGQQLLSALLPPVSLRMENSSFGDADKGKEDSPNLVKILNGQMLQGILDKSVFSKQLLHIIYNDYGHEIAVDFLDSLQAVIATFLMNSGFSVGISDLIADSATNAEIGVVVNKLTKTIEDQILQLHTGLFENSSGRSNAEEFEGKVMNTLNKAVGEAGKIGLQSLADTNRMTNMIKAGSKGSDVNVSQMVATLGQQAIEGKRVPNGFQHRTLPHFKRFDDSAEARGFISSSYVKGLKPHEMYFHAMSGREGLIDTACKTADTGYLQRQIRVALEDLITQHDGSVRDATGNLVQVAYGEDGINATKLENQPLPITTMSDDEIRIKFQADGVEPERQAKYYDELMLDRKILVENVFLFKPKKSVKYPVHLDRLINSMANQLQLKDGAGSVTATEVLDAQALILQKTHANNRIWTALVHYHLSPQNLKQLGYNKAALDALAAQIVLKHWGSWVEPGQPVGVIAAQSIGEPATQMTLNSVDFATEIVIAKDGKIWTPKIGEFIDDYIKTCDQSKIQYLPNDQIYVPLEDGHNWMAASCDETGKMMWTKLEAITKHPVINDDGTDTILEVETESGRVVKATKAKSFLIHRDGKIIDCNGSDLKIGDELPIANSLALGDLGLVDTLDLRTVLSAKEYLFGDEVAKAVAALKKADAEGNRHWFSHANGVEFTVPYNRSDTFRAAFTQGLNTRAAEFLPGFVYPKSTRSCSSHIPAVIPLTREFGFLVGAFIAEGSTSTTQIQIKNNDDSFLVPIRTFLESWKIGHHTVKKEVMIESTGIKGTTQSLIIHSTILTMVFRQLFGVLAHNKTMPDWVTQAPDVFVHGLVDGYFSGDGTVCGKTGSVHASSVSKELLTRISLLLSRYGIFSTMSSYMPEIRKFKSVHMSYKMSIIPKYAKVFGETFTLLSKHKQDRLNVFKGIERRCRREECLDVVLDKVKSIAMVHPWGGKVYDITVETTRNFLIQNGTNLKDTFHLSGVASKSAMTRGVPRLKELMKSTKNPKAIELTIPLRADLRDKKEEARRVAQDLEFTLLQDLVTTARIYYDPRDSETLLRQDADWLAYLAAFEQLTTAATAATQQPDPMNSSSSGSAAAAATAAEVKPTSPWVLRFELDRERMFAKDITMDDIAFLLKKHAEVKVLYSDYNASRLVFRVRPEPEEMAENKTMDDLNVLKALQNRMLGTTAVRGIHGLRSVNYQKVSDVVEFKDGKYQTVDQYILTSDGSNFVDVLTHPDVDPTRVVSSNVHDMFKNLGIEATRATLYKEITTLFAESGSSVNYRHICILLDKICHKGKTMSVDRYGVNKSDIGPLAKMSFEQTEEIVLKAAVFGERDPCVGVSAKVMLGAPIRAGTSFTELMLDEDAAVKLAESTPEQTERGGRVGPGSLTEQAMYDALFGEDVPGPCSLSELRMNVALPPASEDVLPETMEDIEITLID